MSGALLAQLYLKTLVSVEEGGLLILIKDSEIVNSGPVHIITAWNPGENRPSHQENSANNNRLFQRLESLGCSPIRAVGADPDSGHFEESWAVTGLSDTVAREVGAEFGQIAVFRITANAQTVISCFEDWELSRPL